MAVALSGRNIGAAVINACMSGSALWNIVLPAGRLMLQGEGYSLSLSLRMYTATVLAVYTVLAMPFSCVNGIQNLPNSKSKLAATSSSPSF